MTRTGISTNGGHEAASDAHSGRGEASGRGGDIIALIDGALEDRAVSGDAMRWTPDDGQDRRAGSPWVTADEVHAFAVDPADPERTLTRLSLNGIDETHIWTTGESGETAAERIERFAATAFGDDWREANPPRGLIAAAPTVPQPPPFSAESIMETYRAILAATPQPQPYICHPDEYERIRAGLAERGVDVELTTSPYVPAGTVVQLGPTVRADTDYRIDYHADFPPAFDVDLTGWQRSILHRTFTPGWSWSTPAPRATDIWQHAHLHLAAYGNAYVDPRPRRAKLRAIHAAYRAKTRRRNRRQR